MNRVGVGIIKIKAQIKRWQIECVAPTHNRQLARFISAQSDSSND